VLLALEVIPRGSDVMDYDRAVDQRRLELMKIPIF